MDGVTTSPTGETGATRAYAGFEYQIHVSVWVALDAFFGSLRERAEHVEIEPGSQEDLEISLRLPDGQQSPRAPATSKLLVQVKGRSTRDWSGSDLAKVLDGRSVWQHLDTERTHRYLLITDAMVRSELRPLCVSALLERAPMTAALPETLRTPPEVDRAALAGRIAVIEKFVGELVSARIHKLLSQALFVPSTRVEECETLLRERVRERMKRGSRIWTREELLQDIRRFGGRPLRSAELQAFVPPANYAELQARLMRNHALVLQGQPGAGKTLVAQALRHEHQTQEAPFEFRQPKTPGELEAGLLQDGRIFFEVADPFGNAERVPEASRWYGELPRLLVLATPDKKIVVTTRDSVLHEVAGAANKRLRRYAATLTYEHYDQQARRQLLTNKLTKASRWQLELVAAYEQRILDELRAPLSIHHFARLVEDIHATHQFQLEKMLKHSAVDQLAERFTEELCALDWDAVPAAIALWGLLTSSLNFSQQSLDDWRYMVRGQLPQPLYLDKLVQWMSAGRWVVHEEEHYRVHPTTFEGLASLLTVEKEQAQDVLTALLSGLVATERLMDAYNLARIVPEPERTVPAALWPAVQRFCQTQILRVDEKDFQDLFNVATEFVSGEEPVSLIIAGITQSNRRAPGGWNRVGSFHTPMWTETQRAQVAASAEAREVTRRYIQWRLPSDSFKCSGALAAWLWGIGWDLGSDFLEAVNRGLRSPDFGLGEAIHGALMAQSADHEHLLDALLQASDEANRKAEAQSELLRSARQEVLSPFEAEMVTDASREEYGISEAVEAAVSERRHQQGYDWLLHHPRRRDLLYGWEHALAEQMPPHPIFLDSKGVVELHEQWKKVPRRRVQPVTPEELRAFFGSCLADWPEVLWSFFGSTHSLELLPELLELLWTGPARHLESCLAALSWMSTTQGFREQLSPKDAHARCAEILFQSHGQKFGHKKFLELDRSFRALLQESIPCPAPRAFAACLEVETTGKPADETLKKLAPVDRQALKDWSREADSRLGRSAWGVLAALGEDVRAPLLAARTAEDVEHRKAAIRALCWSPDPDARALLKGSLEDEHYECRVLAIRGLAAQADAQERQAILALVRDGSAPVREACVDAIRDGVWAEGLEALCSLLGDTRNRKYGLPDEDVDHHVARAAAKALGAYEVLPDSVLGVLVGFLRKGLEANRDLEVHAQLLPLLVPRRLPELPGALTELLLRLGRTPRSRAPRWPPDKASAVDPRALELRLRVMWGLLNHLFLQPAASESVDLEPLLSIATHPLEPLAAMAWLAMGYLGERAWSECRGLLGDTEKHREEKALLLALGAAKAGRPLRAGPAAEVLADDAIAWRIVEWAGGPVPHSSEEWRALWSQAPEAHAWVTALREGARWSRLLEGWLAQLGGATYRESL